MERVTSVWESCSHLSAEYTNNEGNICEAVTHRTEAEEVTVGNHKSIIKEWEAKTLLVELYGIVECKLLDFHIRTLIEVSSVSNEVANSDMQSS